jgi:hypothetical protein
MNRDRLAAVMPAPAAGSVAAPGGAWPFWDYESELLTKLVGQGEVRKGSLDAALRRRGLDGWELVSCTLDAHLEGSPDGHFLIFKRQVRSSTSSE